MYDENEKINVVPLENITQAIPVVTNANVQQVANTQVVQQPVQSAPVQQNVQVQQPVVQQTVIQQQVPVQPVVQQTVQVQQPVQAAPVQQVVNVQPTQPSVQVTTPTTQTVNTPQQPTVVKRVVVVKKAPVQGPVVVTNNPNNAVQQTVSQPVVSSNIARAINTVSPVQQVVNQTSVAAVHTAPVQVTTVQQAQAASVEPQHPVQSAPVQQVVEQTVPVQQTAQVANIQSAPVQQVATTTAPAKKVVKAGEKVKKPINKKSLIILIALIAILVVAIVVLYFTGYFNVLFGSGSDNKVVTSNLRKIYYYQNEDTYSGSMYESTSLDLVNTYTCASTDCILDSTASSLITYSVIYDNEYVLYDYKNNLEYKTGITGYGNSIDDSGFASMFIYDSIYDLKGIAFNFVDNGNDKLAFYSLSSQRVTYKNSDWVIYIGTDSNPGSNDTMYTDRGYIALAKYAETGYQSKLIDFETGYDVEDSVVDGIYTSVFDSTNNITYPALIDDYNSNNPKYILLSSALKPIVEEFGYLSFADQWNAYSITNSSSYYLLRYLKGNSETIKSSLGNVVDIINNKYLIILNNGKLSIYDKSNNKLIRDVTTLSSGYSYVHSMSSLNENSLIIVVKNDDTNAACGQYEYNITNGEFTVDAECVQ